MADRDALLDNLRAALTGETSRGTERTLEERTAKWETECLERFSNVVEERNVQEVYRRGYYTCTYALGDRPEVDAKTLLELLRAAERQTGWPVWIVFDRPPLAPYPIDGLIECHVYETDQPREPAHSDFWRASPEGAFFLLRGYQEDDPEDLKGKAEPGTAFDQSLPFWRVGECLLHATRMAEKLGVSNTAVHVRMTWTGLRERRLANLFGRWPEPRGGPASMQNTVHARLTVDADRIRLQLVDLVIALTKPLFEVFNFSVPQRSPVQAALTEMLGRTGEN